MYLCLIDYDKTLINDNNEIPYLGFNYPKFRMNTIFLTN